MYCWRRFACQYDVSVRAPAAPATEVAPPPTAVVAPPTASRGTRLKSLTTAARLGSILLSTSASLRIIWGGAGCGMKRLKRSILVKYIYRENGPISRIPAEDMIKRKANIVVGSAGFMGLPLADIAAKYPTPILRLSLPAI
jgi:hypothetical protein